MIELLIGFLSVPFVCLDIELLHSLINEELLFLSLLSSSNDGSSFLNCCFLPFRLGFLPCRNACEVRYLLRRTRSLHDPLIVQTLFSVKVELVKSRSFVNFEPRVLFNIFIKFFIVKLQG